MWLILWHSPNKFLSGILLDVSLNDDGSVNQAGGVLIHTALPDAEESVMETLQEHS